jgi:signal transduction histidine kinase
VQQHLIALAVNLQLAEPLTDDDPAAAKALLVQMRRDVQEALADTAQLAQRIYPPLLEIGGLRAALRAAAVGAGIHAMVEAPLGSTYRPEVARTVCLCWLEALDRARDGRATITVREDDGRLLFEIAAETGGTAAAARSETVLASLRDRGEALGGRLTVRSEAGGGFHVSGFLPLSR